MSTEASKPDEYDPATVYPEISSVTTRSRHSSTGPAAPPVDPYGRTTNCFPICNSVSSAYGGVESYTRAFSFTGNGFPVFDVLGDMNRSARYLQRGGVSIGDVGIIDPSGDFVFAFNIFADADDPLHADDIPGDFEQYPQPQSSELTSTKNHFPPGTVIASKGVQVTRSQDSPLRFSLSTAAREAGVLVLPDGASREDWNYSPALLQYLERHALDWYQQISHNIKASVTTVPNGSVYLITGIDKAPSLSIVAIPGGAELSGQQLNIQYDAEDSKNPWTGGASADITTREADAAPFAVFLRGIRISLSHKAWMTHLDEIPSDETPYFNLLSTPITGFMSKLVRRKEMIFGVPSSSLAGRQQTLFHVSDVLAQIILEEHPDTDFVLIDDSTWNRQLSPASDGTRPEVVNLLTRVLTFYESKADGKVLTLHPKTQDPPEPVNIVRRLLRGLQERRSQQQLVARIEKILNRR